MHKMIGMSASKWHAEESGFCEFSAVDAVFINIPEGFEVDVSGAHIRHRMERFEESFGDASVSVVSDMAEFARKVSGCFIIDVANKKVGWIDDEGEVNEGWEERWSGVEIFDRHIK